MNDVGGSESGTGPLSRDLRAVKSSRTSDTNFDAYDDSEWDVGIGNLIIDLDADIEKNNEANRTSTGTGSSSGGGTVTTTTGNTSVGNGGQQQQSSTGSSSQMHIPRSPSSVTPGNNSGSSITTTLKSGSVKVSTGGTAALASATSNTSSSSTSIGSGNGKSITTPSDLSKSLASVSMEHSAIVEKGLKMKIKRSKPGTKSVDAKHEIVKSDVTTLNAGNTSSSGTSGKNSSINNTNESKLNSTHVKDKQQQQEKDNNNSSNSGNSSNNTSNSTTTSKNEDSGGGSVSGSNSSTGNTNNDQGVTAGGTGTTKVTKTPKRGSAHKKVKSGGAASTITTTSGTNSNNNSTSTANNKKDVVISDGKSSTSSTSSTSHVKDMIFNVSVGSSPTTISAAPTSAFVKTSAASSSSVKGATANSASLIGHSTDSLGNSSTTTSGSAFRSQQQHSTSSNVSSWPVGSPVKGEKGQGRLSPSVTTPNASDKNSPSYGKKPRVFAQTEKSSSSNLEDIVSHPHGNIPNSSYRTSVTLSSASLNDLNTSSCSSSILHQGPPQTGANVISFNSKDASKTGRAPPSSSSSSCSSSHDMCVGTTVGTVTEPDCLGPCEPGTSVTLEGIVWHETESGVLVVNVTWRGKTYVGTLLDCTKNDWAPPRFCDSPTSDLEMRNPKNRGKRGRAQAATPVNDPSPADARTGNSKLRNGVKGRRGSSTASAFVTPVSPLKPDPWPKRKTRGSENESQEETPTAPKNAKRPKVSSGSKENTNTCNSKERQSNSPAPTSTASSTTTADAQSGPFSPALIECPEPNCSKKYKHINGLRYHQSHAHSNNFTPEDSDSNMSTASTTNANNLVLDAKSDGGGNNNENVDSLLPNDSRVDVDMEISTPPDGETTLSSTPTSTTKRNTNNSNSSSTSSTNNNGNNNTTSLSGCGKITPADSQIKETTIPVVTPITTSTVSRTPILTVPVPFSSLSLQNRPLAHAHGHHHHGHGNNNNLGTISRSETLVNDKSNTSPLNRDDVNVMKTQVVTVPSTTNSVVSKGAPWQPHAHSHTSSHGSHAAHVISSLHSQQQQPIGIVPLTVPVIAPPLNLKDSAKTTTKDKSPSDSSILQQQQQTKKQKHKKKSKEKDRERGGGRGDGNNKNGNNTSSKTFSGQNANDKGKDLLDKRRSSLDESDKDGKGGDRDGAGSGERDDPQSPAYSDISDANESGPESDLNVGGGPPTGGVNSNTAKENCVKSLPTEMTSKKDSVVGIPSGHNISSFFPSFYSPYNLDSTNSNSTANSGGNNPNTLTSKSDGSRPNIVPEEPLSTTEGSKTKGKSSSSSSTTHPHMHHGHHSSHGNHPSHSNVPPSPLPPSSVSDDRRSPKVDYTLSSKYLPQHYFAHYPYGNPYHFEQPYGPSILSENSYPTNHNRVFMDEKEREIHNESSRGGGPLKKPGDKDESPVTSLIGNIKLEPGVGDRHDKDRDRREIRPLQSMSMDKESQEIKAEFGENIYGEKRNSLNLLPPQHFMPCSKHSKEAKRDRDDRHSTKDMDMTKETGQMKSGSGRNSVESKSNKSLNFDRDRDGSNDGDKDGKDNNKNEGSKPTMETQGPPPPPTGSYAYIPQSYLQETFCHPLYRQVLVPGPYPGAPYMHPGSIPRYPPTPGSTPLPEDLSRPSGSGPPGSAKALDLLQHHAAQYYASHKIHELQERALKSPSPQVPGPQGTGPGVGGVQNLSGTSNSPGIIVPERPVRGNISGGGSSGGNPPGTTLANKPADLTKDTKPVIIGGLSGTGQPSESRSPPTQHHVHSHTHHHTHVGIGYPIINHPTVPPQYSPHYGTVLATPSVTAVAASVITPYPSKPT